MSAQVTEITVAFKSYEAHSRMRGKPRARRLFNTDEEYAQYLAMRAIYIAAGSTVEWEYPKALDRWTAADIDAIILRALDTMAALPNPEGPGLIRGDQRHGAGCVSFEYNRTKAHGFHTDLTITSLRTAYFAEIRINGTVPARAITLMVEQHGRCKGEITMRMDGNIGYMPTFQMAEQIVEKWVAR
jgi:hypothetical protein